MAQLTAFGKAAKKALIDRGQSQEWLIGEIKAATGQYVDGGYLYKIFTGQRSAPKIVASINEILGLDSAESEGA
jgi:hypothetical protein